MTKTEIVKAAFTVWGREFYLNTSLSQVAHELGVSKPALYRHFRGKQALLDAMTEYFFDDFAAFIRPNHEKALESPDLGGEGIFTLIRAVAEYFARNVDTFIFSLVNLYDQNSSGRKAASALKLRGVDMGVFHQTIKKDYAFDLLIMRVVFTTLSFFMAGFHKQGKTFAKSPSEGAISKIIDTITEIIGGGLGYTNKEIDALDYTGLEKRVAGTVREIEDDPLLKAVAEAVAEAGPWEASMEQVARRSGLSKSSLYGHFKNKQDMLRQLFMTEFGRIFQFARQGLGESSVPQEQLYLGIFSIAAYLRSRPQILVALNWIRTRRLDLGKPGKRMDFFRLFEDIDIRSLRDRDGEYKQQMSHWILFLIINVLLRDEGRVMGDVPNSDIRFLYKFLTLGIKGFKV